MSDLRKLRALEPRECRALAIAALLLPMVALALRFASLRAVSRALAVVESGRVREPLPAARVAQLTEIASRRGAIAATCIVRSVVLRLLLARHGHVSRIRFGALKEERGIRAHAWVECEGRALLESSAKGYSAFSPYGAE
jgi:hypothetical protein